MTFLSRFKRGALPLSRIEAFSDGVFAIIVTLLVLELKVPHLRDHMSAGELGMHLTAQLPSFLSWLISFIIVCKFWLNHHQIMSLAKQADYALVWLNSLFLMCQAFIPFPTAMLGEYSSNPLAITIFGAVMAINTLMFMLLQAYIMRNLIKPELADEQEPYIMLKSVVGPVSYLIGALMGWLSAPLAFIVFMLTPLFFIVPPEYKKE